MHEKKLAMCILIYLPTIFFVNPSIPSAPAPIILAGVRSMGFYNIAGCVDLTPCSHVGIMVLGDRHTIRLI